MSKFVQFLVNFGVRYETSYDLLLELCEHFMMDQSRSHLLLTELQSSQKNTSSMFTAKEQLICSLARRGNRLKEFGVTDNTMIVGMSLKYVDSDTLLRDILLVCRDFNEILKPEVLK